MSPVIVTLLAFAVYALAYRYYARFLAERVFKLDDARPTPAHTLNDGVDYVPTRPAVLFGHHYASIAGLGPMLGPAVAVIWGWLPALVWVVFGAVLIGCVHDFAALVVSIRSKGMSVGQVAHGVVGARARTLFHLIIFFGIALAMGVFVFVIARLFSLELAPGHAGYPQAVLPSALLMVIAAVSGVLLYRHGARLAPVIAVGFALELLSIWMGTRWPTMGLAPESWPGPAMWTYILLGYGFLASVLPVWTLLQPRDFLNSLLLYLGLAMAYAGFFALDPSFAAPAIASNPPGAPGLVPFVFIVIACGAASGFHGLVSSGTTAKQLDRETHARGMGYGGMIGESLLGLLATLACTAGFASPALWHHHYGSWRLADGLSTKIDAFIQGTANFVSALGVPPDLAAALIAMIVVSFALTTLDSATRLLRFNIEEIGATLGMRWLGNRYLSSLLACAAIGWFAFYKVNGKPAGLALWQLFGTTNQLLAGLTLGLVSLYLWQRRWPVWPTLAPCLFMMVSTLAAMAQNLREFYGKDTLLFSVGVVLFALAAWLVVEAALVLGRAKRTDNPEIVASNE